VDHRRRAMADRRPRPGEPGGAAAAARACSRAGSPSAAVDVLRQRVDAAGYRDEDALLQHSADPAVGYAGVEQLGAGRHAATPDDDRPDIGHRPARRVRLARSTRLACSAQSRLPAAYLYRIVAAVCPEWPNFSDENPVYVRETKKGTH